MKQRALQKKQEEEEEHARQLLLQAAEFRKQQLLNKKENMTSQEKLDEEMRQGLKLNNPTGFQYSESTLPLFERVKTA